MLDQQNQLLAMIVTNMELIKITQMSEQRDWFEIALCHIQQYHAMDTTNVPFALQQYYTAVAVIICLLSPFLSFCLTKEPSTTISNRE